MIKEELTMAMKLEKENVRIILGNILEDVDCWGVEGKEAEKILPISLA